MSKCIALCGVSNTGKSTTLNLLIKLLDVYFNELPIKVKMFNNVNNKKDNVKAYEINKKTVLVITAGDSKEYIIDRIKRAQQQYGISGYDILVCACHKGGMQDYLKSIHSSIIYHSVWKVDGDNNLWSNAQIAQVHELFRELI